MKLNKTKKGSETPELTAAERIEKADEAMREVCDSSGEYTPEREARSDEFFEKQGVLDPPSAREDDAE